MYSTLPVRRPVVARSVSFHKAEDCFCEEAIDYHHLRKLLLPKTLPELLSKATLLVMTYWWLFLINSN